VEKLKWVWERLGSGLEALSPFWTAYAITLTEIIGAGILALPIAVARIGPLGGVFLLLLIGVLRATSYMAESVSRNGIFAMAGLFRSLVNVIWVWKLLQSCTIFILINFLSLITSGSLLPWKFSHSCSMVECFSHSLYFLLPLKHATVVLALVVFVISV
jgi:amino acid permease